MNPRAKNVAPLDGYKLHIEFDNGEIRVYDCTSFLDFGVLKELKNIQYFKMASVVAGTVVWPHEQDICPDTLYLDSIKYTEQCA